MTREIPTVSNELEFSLFGIDASSLMGNGLPVVHEVNSIHMLELNVSMVPDVEELNRLVALYTRQLVHEAESHGGNVYGGSSVLSNTSDVQPTRHRTTSLSETFARGLLDITSHQVVIGVSDEGFGFELYNYLVRAAPVFIAMSASSPYTYEADKLQDTGCASRRILQYEKMCRFYPASMWRDAPLVNSVGDYREHLTAISAEVRRRLESGELDANWEELMKVRQKNGRTLRYIDFDTLEPHQIYWNVRPRTDHMNHRCAFSLEVRMPDMPTTVERIQMTNSLILGLAYYVADNGVPYCAFDGSFEALRAASIDGLDAKIDGYPVVNEAERAVEYASEGLKRRGYNDALRSLETTESVLAYGNDANLITRSTYRDPAELIGYLSSRLKNGE